MASREPAAARTGRKGPGPKRTCSLLPPLPLPGCSECVGGWVEGLSLSLRGWHKRLLPEENTWGPGPADLLEREGFGQTEVEREAQKSRGGSAVEGVKFQVEEARQQSQVRKTRGD